MKYAGRLLSLALLFCLALLFALPMRATDAFTVNVPVSFSHMNAAVTGIRISCRVTGQDPVTLHTRSFGTFKSIDLPLKGGSYAGPSPVTFVFRVEDFSAEDQSVLGSVTGGSCNFGVFSGGSEYQPYGGETSPVLAQKPGTPFRSQTSFVFK